MSKETPVNTTPVFYVAGQTVNGLGQEVDTDGTVKDAGAADAANVQQLIDANTQLKSDLDAALANTLPEDALKRLVSVDGIGEKLAQKALDALTAKG